MSETQNRACDQARPGQRYGHSPEGIQRTCSKRGCNLEGAFADRLKRIPDRLNDERQ
jgi:hypothetical protein